MNNDQYAKILSVIAGVLLLVAVRTWPYSYYQVLRWVVAITAIVNAYRAYELRRTAWVFTMGAVAILFNPVASIHFPKQTWQVFDIAAAAVMFLFVGFILKWHGRTEAGQENGIKVD